MTLPFHATKKQQYGAAVEEWVLAQLLAQGYAARLISRWGAAGDLVIDDTAAPIVVEVKAARRRMRKVRPGYYAPEWRWHVANLRPVDHLLALVAEDDMGRRYLYLVPSWVAFGRQGLSISSHPHWYRGRLAQFRDCWASVATVAEQRAKHINVQLSFEGV